MDFPSCAEIFAKYLKFVSDHGDEKGVVKTTLRGVVYLHKHLKHDKYFQELLIDPPEDGFRNSSGPFNESTFDNYLKIVRKLFLYFLDQQAAPTAKPSSGKTFFDPDPGTDFYGHRRHVINPFSQYAYHNLVVLLHTYLRLPKTAARSYLVFIMLGLTVGDVFEVNRKDHLNDISIALSVVCIASGFYFPESKDIKVTMPWSIFQRLRNALQHSQVLLPKQDIESKGFQDTENHQNSRQELLETFKWCTRIIPGAFNDQPTEDLTVAKDYIGVRGHDSAPFVTYDKTRKGDNEYCEFCQVLGTANNQCSFIAGILRSGVLHSEIYWELQRANIAHDPSRPVLITYWKTENPEPVKELLPLQQSLPNIRFIFIALTDTDMTVNEVKDVIGKETLEKYTNFEIGVLKHKDNESNSRHEPKTVFVDLKGNRTKAELQLMMEQNQKASKISITSSDVAAVNEYDDESVDRFFYEKLGTDLNQENDQHHLSTKEKKELLKNHLFD